MSELFTQPIPGLWAYVIGFIALCGWLVNWRMQYWQNKLTQQCGALVRENELLQSELDTFRDQSYHWQQQYQQQSNQQGQWQAKAEYAEQLQLQLDKQRSQLEQSYQLQAQLQSKLARAEQQQCSQQQQLQLLEQTEQRFKEAFENLANQIFDKKSSVLQEQNQLSLTGLLGPLRQQLENFRQQVQQSYDTESRERHSLKAQVERLSELNQQMSTEALNLTRALKGDNKQQGNWGEVVLSRLLEESGLRQDHEYRMQVSGKNQQGQLIKPDVVVDLPKQRCVIIDSKVTLVAYERFCRAEDDKVREQELQAHVRSLKGHINGLGKKNYQTLYGVHGLDFVLLFVPIEAAFQLAIQHDAELIPLASRLNILLVSPSSLLVALRTVENLWRSEYQQRNVAEIAERAGRLYDKFCGFVDDLLLVGGNLDKAQGSYHSAIQKLSQGRGNLVGQAQQLRDLQIPTTKQLPDQLINEVERL
ncbi:DNA recombination protein RmuC [Celerinatantimonas yamalensis]|uniref:DNA recombination protein RmuC n=1 Tax=Celerinatantimonas yamalensis TaxID=559956 RepID=A0ABW9G5B6_9GAMM